MLDLNAIFNPEQTPPVPAPAPGLDIGPDDLPGDWRVEWEERASIVEYDGGLPRERAEAEALRDILAQMRRAGDRP